MACFFPYVLDLKSQIRTWKGRPRSGVKVRWTDTSFVGLYRCASAVAPIFKTESCLPRLVNAHTLRSDPALAPRCTRVRRRN